MGRPKKGERRERVEFAREQVLNMKGTSDYNDFVDAVQDKTGIAKSEMFRRAFREWCERNGHGTPPPI